MRRDCYDAEGVSIPADCLFAGQLVDLVDGRVKGARKTVASALGLTFDLDTVCGHDIAEWSGGLEVDGVHAEFDECITI